MRARTHTPIDDLRLAIDCLPLRTREAMLEGIRANEIIVGAYTDRAGGVCPMLAAHRHGGRTSFVSLRARVGPLRRRQAGAARHRRASCACWRTSWRRRSSAPRPTSARAIAEHQALARDRRAREARRTGLGWLTDRRAEADAERALAEAERRRELVER